MAPDGWRWNGKVAYGLQSRPWALLAYHWERPARTEREVVLLAKVWSHDSQATADAVRGAQSRANAWLEQHGIPLRVAREGGFVDLRQEI